MKKTLSYYIMATLLASSAATPCFSSEEIGDSIKGVVVDSIGRPIEGAAVAWLSLPDSTIMGGAITMADGTFAIKMGSSAQAASAAQKSLLTATCVGFERTMANVMQTVSGIRMSMKETTHKLKGVTVTSKSTMASRPGGFVFTPRGADLLLPDAYDVLRYLPLVTIDRNGVSITGAGTSQIYINGKPPRMSHEMVVEMLRTADPKDIVRIEILQNPGFSYGAEGGVLNVVLKRQDYGALASLTAYGSYSNERLSPIMSSYVGLSYGKLKAAFGLGGGYYFQRFTSDEYYNYKNTGTEISNRKESTPDAITGSFRANASYDFTPNSVLGLSVSMGVQKNETDAYTLTTKNVDKTGPQMTKSTSQGDIPIKRPSVSSTLYYSLTTDKRGSALDIDASYSNSYFESPSTTTNEMWDAQAGLYKTYQTYMQTQIKDNDAYEANARYKNIFKDHSVLNVGAEMTRTEIDDDFNRSDLVDGAFVTDSKLSNRFIYKETIFSLYAEYERQWNKVFSSRVGLRGEFTSIDGKLADTGESFDNNYQNVEPNASLSFDLFKGRHALVVNYNTYIIRPFYKNLSPFKVWLSENTYTIGNPYAKAIYSHNFGFTYRFPLGISVGSRYNFAPKSFSDYRIMNGDNTTEIGTNYSGKGKTLSSNIEYSNSFLKGRLRVRANISGYYNKREGEMNGINIGYENFDYYFSTSCYAYLGKSRQLMLGLRYMYKSETKLPTRYTEPLHNIYFTARWDLEKAGQIELNADCNLNNRATYFDSPEYYYRTRNWKTWSNTYISLSYNIVLGKDKVRGARNKNNTKFSKRNQ